MWLSGAWMALSVKCPTLDFNPGHDLMVHGIEPFLVLYVDSVEPAWDSLSLSLCPSPAWAHACMHTLSQVNKLWKIIWLSSRWWSKLDCQRFFEHFSGQSLLVKYHQLLKGLLYSVLGNTEDVTEGPVHTQTLTYLQRKSYCPESILVL